MRNRLLLPLALLLLALPLAAADPAGQYFSGLQLVDQDGHDVDLYGLMKGRTIVIESFFSTCTGSCPIMARSLLAVQKHYADRIGKDIVLVSITVDPATDTPARLKEYARTVGAKEGWYFLTGSKEQVERALRKLGQYVERREDHVNILIAGNDKTGLWKKIFGLAKSDEIIPVIASVVDDTGK